MTSRRRLPLAALLLCALLLCCACRTRVSGGAPVPAEAVPGETAGGAGEAGEAQSGEASEPSDGETAPDEPGGRTAEDPRADRREYDPAAPVELIPSTDRFLHAEGEGDGAAVEGGDLRAVPRVDEDAEETATRTVPAEESSRLAVSADADEADSALQYYRALLDDRLGSLFECKRVYLYWETAEDRVTVHRTSAEHALILEAGVYDVSQRLTPERLRIDDGWIARKDPDVIVKAVPADVLGARVTSDAAARSLRAGLLAREGWSALKAVRNGRLILLSEELLGSEALETAARVVIAVTAYPELFADTDPETALRELAEEAAGLPPAGVFFLTDRPR